jgi:hypothetical protein
MKNVENDLKLHYTRNYFIVPEIEKSYKNTVKGNSEKCI